MHNLDDISDANVRRPVWARWLTRFMLLICGAMMVLIILSQPKVAQAVGERLIGSSGYSSQPAADPNLRPVVSARPQDRVPVKRAVRPTNG